MTEIASPEPTQPDSAAVNGENAHHDGQTSNETVDSGDSSLSDASMIDEMLNGDFEHLENGTAAEQPSPDEAITNGQPHESDKIDGEPPAKRRRIRDATPERVPRKPKPISPPWKKIEAEGPSSFKEGGRRKSGRINTVPIELQTGDKRITRRSLHQSSPPKNKYGSVNGSGSAMQSSPASSKKPASASKSAPARAAPPKPVAKPTPRPASRKSLSQETPKPSSRLRRRSSSSQPHATPPKPKPAPAVGTRRSARHAHDDDEVEEITSPQAGRTFPRIKLRVRPPLSEIPLVNREQANVRPKIGSSFEKYFEEAADVPVEKGGLFASEDGPEYTDELALADAEIIMRIEDEAEPGGLLSEGLCSAFAPEPEEEPPRQWAHMDHLTKAMTGFRRLMVMEHQRHRATAKKLALACEAEWKRRNPQPKTAEEIEQEEIEKSKSRWRLVNKVLAGTWENVKIEVNRRRLARWHAEEERRVKAALNQAVDMSEMKLQAQQARQDTEDMTDDLDEDGDDEGDDMLSDVENDAALSGDDANEEGSKSGSGEDEDEDNMSTSEDEEDKNSLLSDEGLTQDELREKYANLPALNEGSDAEGDAVGDGPVDDDTSDESIDMDDDLGSSDEDMDSDEDEEEDQDGAEDESEEEKPSLLSMLFNKSQLKKLKQEDVDDAQEDIRQTTETCPGDIAATSAEDAEMLDGDPVTEVAGQTEHQPPADGVPEGQEGLPTTLPSSKVPKATVNGTAGADRLNHDQGDIPLEDQQPSLNGDAEGLPTKTDETVKSALEKNVDESIVSNGIEHNETAAPGITAPGAGQLVGEDVSMVDAPAVAPQPKIPEVTIAEAPIGTEQPSPETDVVTNPHSASRSQSPPTSETKPSDLETASSVELLSARHADDSRSASPLPAAPKTEIPFLLRGTLREYQHYGLDWLAGLYANNTNGILADEMGLGKTIQTIALIAHLACYHEVWGPHLVIVPTSVMLNWEMEFKKWCPGFKILTYYGNQEERKRKRHGWTNDDIWNVCITSYQMVLADNQVFRRRRWHYMILDEAHNIKNFRSQRWQTLLGFNTQARLLLTGTPLQNNLTELWSLLYFLAPPENGEGGFADLSEFHNWFARPESQILENGRENLDDEARAIIAKLHKVLRPYLLRRLKADVEKQMPAKVEHIEFCRLSKRQRELYDGFLSRSETRDILGSGNYLSIINCLMQLRKVCNHPDLFIDRPIMTSFRMQQSVPADFETEELFLRKTLLFEKPMTKVSLGFLNMIPAQHEHLSTSMCERISQLSSHRIFMDLREAQKTRAQNAYASLDPGLDPSTVKSNIVYLESAARWGRFEELQHVVYLNALRRQQRPIYGHRLVEMLTLDTHLRPFKKRPKVPKQIMAWFEEDMNTLRHAIPTLNERAASLEMTITKFSCVTPAVVTRDMNRLLLGKKGVEIFEEIDLKLAAPIRKFPFSPPEPPVDPWHVSRIRSTIQFPDKRLLQYDCGKLQVLDKLLRKLQSGGHRALIFTQMAKMLDILEQFLNIHGHKYLRLDGATKVEQRQILTDRFNHDTRILCFILSTRSGGLGINLTGADTVIFYDQDWNPAMDKQCQDRCHRIGQTRDVHIYRLVSEHTIEANILRKASQKQMLDDVVIQEGEFTTDYFHKISVRDVIGNNGEVVSNENDVAANAAMDRVLGGPSTSGSGAGSGSISEAVNERVVGRRLEQAEDTEDVAAARLAEKEIQQDDADFLEQRPTPGASTRQGTPRDATDGQLTQEGEAQQSAEAERGEVERNAWGEVMRTVDDYMLQSMEVALEGTPLDLPKDKKKGKKKGKDTRKR